MELQVKEAEWVVFKRRVSNINKGSYVKNEGTGTEQDEPFSHVGTNLDREVKSHGHGHVDLQ